jgi:hypothetical protein
MNIPSHVTVNMPKDPGNHKVSIIKCLRELTNLTLKEAKDLSETTGPTEGPVIPQAYVDGEGYRRADEAYSIIINRLRTLGVTVKEPDLIDRVRRLAAEAVLDNNLHLAQDLIAVLTRQG